MNWLSPSLQQVDRTYVLHRGQKLTYFGGCDYFRLASHPAVLQALPQGLDRYGLNVAASRRTTGNHALYEQLEQRLAGFFEVESATLVSSGYLSNLAAAQALAGRFTHAMADDHAHASLMDAARFLDCPILTFQHRDPNDLARAIRRCGGKGKLILLSDGIFPHNGEVAPLREYLEVLPARSVILLDDAHGAGAIGETGQGTLEYLGIGPQRSVRTLTLSKAFGVYGGAILGHRALGEAIRAKSKLFVGNTPLPLPLVCAALKSLEILQADSSLRLRLVQNTRYVKETLRRQGLAGSASPSPIIPLLPKRAKDIGRLEKACLANRIYPSFIHYPGGPKQGYFRFAISSEHTAAQLDALLKVLISGNETSRMRTVSAP